MGRPKGSGHLASLTPNRKGEPRRGGKQKGTKNSLTEARMAEEVRRIALYDPLDFYDPAKRFTLRQLKAVPKELRSCIAWMRTKTVNVTAGDDQQDEVVDIRLVDKMRALELLARKFGWFKGETTVNVEGFEALMAKLDAWKQRNRQEP